MRELIVKCESEGYRLWENFGDIAWNWNKNESQEWIKSKWHLILADIQRWLRDEEEIALEVFCIDSLGSWGVHIEASTPTALERLDSLFEFNTYEQALQEAITKALELI